MSVAEIISIARDVSHFTEERDADRLAAAVLDLLAESAPCGFEAPHVDSAGIYVPATWVAAVTADDARGMARMLLAAADESEVSDGR